MINNKKRRS